MHSNSLLTSVRVGDVDLPNRVAMAPLTRSRAAQPGDVPARMSIEYYTQRASAGLIITEATWVEPRGRGYAFTPGIHSEEQVAAWREIVDGVHDRGGRMALQLWHVGRISHVDLQPGGQAPIAPSAIRAASKTYTETSNGMVETSTPRALETSEIPGIIDAYRRGAERAREAGFDMVEIHGANGYLLDQFTRDGTNARTDAYGGSVEARTRLGVEVAEAVASVFGAGRVGYRISPLSGFNDMRDSEPSATFGRLAERLGDIGLAYLHVVEDAGDGSGRGASAEPVLDTIRSSFKNAGGGVYMGNHAYESDEAAARIEQGKADLIAFGKLYISNPDLVERIRAGGPFNEWDESTFYGGDEQGYIDYPTLEQSEAA